MNRLQSWISKSEWKSFLKKEQLRNEKRIIEVQIVIRDMLDEVQQISEKQIKLIDRMAFITLHDTIETGEIELINDEIDRLDEQKERLETSIADRKDYLNTLLTNYGKTGYRFKTPEGNDGGSEQRAPEELLGGGIQKKENGEL